MKLRCPGLSLPSEPLPTEKRIYVLFTEKYSLLWHELQIIILHINSNAFAFALSWLLSQVLAVSSYCCWDPLLPGCRHAAKPLCHRAAPSMPCSAPSSPSFQTPSLICQSNSEFKASSQGDMQLHPAWFKYWMNKVLIPSPTSLIAIINSPVLFETN